MKALIGVRVHEIHGIDRLQRLTAAFQERFDILKTSSIYRLNNHLQDRARGIGAHQVFSELVAVFMVETELDPEAVYDRITEVEDVLAGTQNQQPYWIYYLCHQDQTRMTPRLTLPFPRWHQRPDLVISAAEIWGDWRHPVLERSLFDLAKDYAQVDWGSFHLQGKILFSNET